MELKLNMERDSKDKVECFNRTFMELKFRKSLLSVAPMLF